MSNTCCNGRYEFVEEIDYTTGTVSQIGVIESKDGAGNPIIPSVFHLAGTPGFDAAVTAAETCTGQSFGYQVLCDENGDRVLVRFETAFDGTQQATNAFNIDGTDYTGPTALNDLTECDDGQRADVEELVVCDDGTTKVRVTTRVFDEDGTVLSENIAWQTVTGAAIAAPADPTLVTAGACPVSRSIHSSCYC